MPDAVVQLVPSYVLVLFRVAGMMTFAPLFGSAKIPKRVRGLLAVVLTVGLLPGVPPPARLPDSAWAAALGIGGELTFGIAMGMAMSFTFTAAQWAGEMIGQQMGLNMSEVFDPQFGQQGSLVGDVYFMLTLVVFLAVGGHHAMLLGVRASFAALPLLSAGADARVLGLLNGMFQASAGLAVQLAAPMFVTMLVVDLAMGFIGKTMPQMNVMSVGTSLRGVVGMVVLWVGLKLTGTVIGDAVLDSMGVVTRAWAGAIPR